MIRFIRLLTATSGWLTRLGNGDVAKWLRPAAHNGVTGGSNPSVPTILLLLCLLATGAEAKEAKASWYERGKLTANGQLFNPDGFSVAHKNLPFGTMVKLTNPKTGKTIVAVVNDRGPYIKGRELDVSRGAAIALGFFHTGVAKLLIEVLDKQKVKNGYHKVKHR